MAVLGLLTRGRASVATVHTRLSEEFPHSNFPRNSAYTGLPRLADKGWVRLVRPGEESSEDIYEITPHGLEAFEHWLHGIAVMPPPIRDPLHGKLAFVGLDGLDRIIEIVKEYEKAASKAYSSAHGEVHALTIRGVAGRPQLKLDRIRHEFTATLWGQQTLRLSGLREKLEDLKNELDHPEP